MNEITSKFLLAVDRNKKQIYILHRLYPACLIQVVQETPMRFVVQDLYDEMENTEDIVKMEFVKEAKRYFNKLIEEGLELN